MALEKKTKTLWSCDYCGKVVETEGDYRGGPPPDGWIHKGAAGIEHYCSEAHMFISINKGKEFCCWPHYLAYIEDQWLLLFKELKQGFNRAEQYVSPGVL